MDTPVDISDIPEINPHGNMRSVWVGLSQMFLDGPRILNMDPSDAFEISTSRFDGVIQFQGQRFRAVLKLGWESTSVEVRKRRSGKRVVKIIFTETSFSPSVSAAADVRVISDNKNNATAQYILQLAYKIACIGGVVRLYVVDKVIFYRQIDARHEPELISCFPDWVDSIIFEQGAHPPWLETLGGKMSAPDVAESLIFFLASPVGQTDLYLLQDEELDVYSREIAEAISFGGSLDDILPRIKEFKQNLMAFVEDSGLGLDTIGYALVYSYGAAEYSDLAAIIRRLLLARFTDTIYETTFVFNLLDRFERGSVNTYVDYPADQFEELDTSRAPMEDFY